MKWFLAVNVFIIVAVLARQTLGSGWVVMNEDKLLSTCTRTCEKVPTLYHKFGCERLSHCRRSSKGWTRGWVRCDYCRCYCLKKTVVKKEDVRTSVTKLSVTEKELYGTCKVTCTHRRGLARTNFKDCQQVKDCRLARKGRTSWFWRCDYCTCNCVRTSYAASYVIENPKYDLSRAAIRNGAPKAMAHLTIVNRGNVEQTTDKWVRYTTSMTKTVTTSKSLTLGLAITVSAGGTIGPVNVETSVQTSISHETSYSVGKSKTETIQQDIRASVKVPARSSRKILVVCKRMKIDVPYTATLVTTYKDGSKTRKRISGVYKQVSYSQGHVTYEPAKRL